MIANKFLRIFAVSIVTITMYAAVPVSAEKIAVIVNKNNTETIDMPTLRRIFLKEFKIWSSGQEVVPLDMGKVDIKTQFAKAVLGKDINGLKMYWIQKRITESLRAPLSLKSAEQVKKYVAKIPNAIGYIPVSNLDDSVKKLFEIE